MVLTQCTNTNSYQRAAKTYLCVDDPQNDAGEKVKQQKQAEHPPDRRHRTTEPLAVGDVVLGVGDVTVLPNSAIRSGRTRVRNSRSGVSKNSTLEDIMVHVSYTHVYILHNIQCAL